MLFYPVSVGCVLIDIVSGFRCHRFQAVSVRFSDVYGPLDRNTGARNRHNAPYWVCRKARRILRGGTLDEDGEKFRIAGKSIHEVCWDIIDAPR